MNRAQRTTTIAVVVVISLASLAAAQGTRQQFSFVLHHGGRANIEVRNVYGSVTVRPGAGGQVVVSASLPSDKVEIDKGQRGNRLQVTSHLLAGSNKDNSRVDYELEVPADSNVTLETSDGTLHAERLHGDLTFNGPSATVEVRDCNKGHVHVNTMNGPVTLTNVRDAHVEIVTVSGVVVLNAVSGTLTEAKTGSGKILYDGDFGAGGKYRLTTNDGPIEALIPAVASAGIHASSMLGTVASEFPLHPFDHTSFILVPGRNVAGFLGKGDSDVELQSHSGTIRIKKKN